MKKNQLKSIFEGRMYLETVNITISLTIKIIILFLNDILRNK